MAVIDIAADNRPIWRNADDLTAPKSAQHSRVPSRVASVQRKNGGTRTNGRRWLACYHEAGHALARWYFGHFTDRVLVLTLDQVRRRDFPKTRHGVPLECEGVCLGYDIGPSPMNSPATVRAAWGGTKEGLEDFMERHLQEAAVGMIVDIAGSFAEARYRHCSHELVVWSGAFGDYDSYLYRLRTWFFGDKENAGEMAWLRARALIRSARGWRAIETIAALLYETGELDGTICEELCAKAYDITRHPGLGAVIDSWPIAPAAIRSGWLP